MRYIVGAIHESPVVVLTDYGKIVDKIINIKSDYTTLANLTFETSGEDGIVIDADNVTVYNCTIRGIINNGIVSNGYKCDMMGDARSVLQFKNGEGFIESAWVAHTGYSYFSAMKGCDMAEPLTAEQSIWIEAKGYTLDAEGKEVEGNALTLYLYEGGKASFSGWKKWDLSSLGKVQKVKFDVQWNGEGGADAFMHPAYFALDDITVVKE